MNGNYRLVTSKGTFALGDDDKVDFKMSSQIGCMATEESVHIGQRRQLNSDDITQKWVVHLFLGDGDIFTSPNRRQAAYITHKEAAPLLLTFGVNVP